MFKRVEPNTKDVRWTITQFPHCDQRILHAPGECTYCDAHPEWQRLREAWGISFTGFEPEAKELPCPADYARGDSHTKWYGNVAEPPSSASEDYGEAMKCNPCDRFVYRKGGLIYNEENDLLHSCFEKD